MNRSVPLSSESVLWNWQGLSYAIFETPQYLLRWWLHNEFSDNFLCNLCFAISKWILKYLVCVNIWFVWLIDFATMVMCACSGTFHSTCQARRAPSQHNINLLCWSLHLQPQITLSLTAREHPSLRLPKLWPNFFRCLKVWAGRAGLQKLCATHPCSTEIKKVRTKCWFHTRTCSSTSHVGLTLVLWGANWTLSVSAPVLYKPPARRQRLPARDKQNGTAEALTWSLVTAAMTFHASCAVSFALPILLSNWQEVSLFKSAHPGSPLLHESVVVLFGTSFSFQLSPFGLHTRKSAGIVLGLT